MPYAIVVVVHLSPERESQYAEVLHASTDLPVHEVSDTADIRPGHVYVVPPGRHIRLSEGVLHTRPFDDPADRRHTIDHFFQSLARADTLTGVAVLSGSGTDGAQGVTAVKSEWGFVLVQDPNEAEHESMPRAAINTANVDSVLPAREIGIAFLKMLQTSQHRLLEADLHSTESGEDATDADSADQILGTIRAAIGYDFSDYKKSTVLRRIRRRMQVTHSESLQAYLDIVQTQDKEAQALFRELLVGVTQFFRNEESFDALKQQVIPKLFEGKTEDDTLRIWVVGCSTGEEVYSLAMLLHEYASETARAPRIQIFASDLSPDALQTARKGVYPASIERDISPDRLRRFFEQRQQSYALKQEFRNEVIFSQHSVLRDPPFSRIDLISCRNVLIFLNRSAQQRVLQTFHYALEPEGYLFLGSSETPGKQNWFQPVDTDHHVYQAQDQDQSLPQLSIDAYGTPFPGMDDEQTDEPFVDDLDLDAPSSTLMDPATTHLRLLEHAAPPSILVDIDRNVVHLSESAGRYLQPRGGTPSNKIADLMHPDLRDEVSEALGRLFVSGEQTAMRRVTVQFDGPPRDVYVSVQRGTNKATHTDASYALILFMEGEASSEGTSSLPTAPGAEPNTEAGETGNEQAMARLRDRLSDMQLRLREAHERFKKSRERMQAQNEELRSINEEYKSATEELETSKEELQSVNEELETVNNQLEQKLNEVSRAHSDLKNLIDATDIATVFLDDNLQIQRFTPSMNAIFHIRDADLGRPITELAHDLTYDDLRSDAETVLDDLSPVVREVQDTDDNWYLVRVRPYRTVENVIDGVVFTFVDITEQKHTEQHLQDQKEFAESIVNTIREGLVVLDADLHVTSTNAWFDDILNRNATDVDGQPFFDIGAGYWDLPDLRDALEGLLSDDESFEGLQITHAFDDRTERTLLFNAQRLEQGPKILLVIEDITQRTKAIQEVKKLNKALKARVQRIRELASDLSMAEHQERKRVSQILHDDLQQLLYAIEGKMQLILNEIEDPNNSEFGAQLQELKTWTGKALKTTRQLTVDLSPPILQEETLADAFGWLKSQMNELYDFDVIIEANDIDPLSDDIRLLLFQIVRELLFNVQKHAGVDVAVVQLHAPDADAPGAAADSPLVVHVIDKGKGFNPEATSTSAIGGLGLRRAQERLDLLGGHLSIESTPGVGTRASVYAPPRRDDESSDNPASPM